MASGTVGVWPTRTPLSLQQEIRTFIVAFFSPGIAKAEEEEGKEEEEEQRNSGRTSVELRVEPAAGTTATNRSTPTFKAPWHEAPLRVRWLLQDRLQRCSACVSDIFPIRPCFDPLGQGIAADVLRQSTSNQHDPQKGNPSGIQVGSSALHNG
ncbi:hypothetical protein ANO11243_030510 [Dothideomycetidae sp. 11243]|nr:hypothetical protein ANO11243_030510 [fungal sp. No.11243]